MYQASKCLVRPQHSMEVLDRLNQTATYWPPLFADGYGGYRLSPPSITYTGTGTDTGTATEDVSPEALPCRWDDKTEAVLNAQGEEVLSRAQVMFAEAVEEGGYLFFGASADAPDDPSLGDNLAFKIIRVVKTPTIDAEDFIWVAFL